MSSVRSVLAEVAFPRASTLGEGCLWDSRRNCLYWVDIYQNKVFLYYPDTRANVAYDVGSTIGTVVPCEDGQLLVALRQELARLDLKSGTLTSVAKPSGLDAGVRFNDGKCDPRGRFWVGTMVEKGPPGKGVLYRLSSDLALTAELRDLTISNGLVWYGSHFYHIDTPTQQIREFDYDAAAGTIANPRVVARFEAKKGAPDGMCVDAEGKLWVALYGGGGVVRIDPRSGAEDFRVQVPATNATSCAFGGPDLGDLYITTARAGLSNDQLEREPLAGSLFRVHLPFEGARSQPFASDFRA